MKLRLGNTVSSEQNIIFGVSQGSPLGTLLFVLFINDLINIFDE